jgi:hypothetical protein
MQMHADRSDARRFWLNRHWLTSDPVTVQARHPRSSAFICG